MDPSRDPRAHARPALSARLRRWLRPPRTLRPTLAGWCFFGLIFGVGFAALNTGNNLLYLVLAQMLGFLVLSGLLSESALRGISVRRLPPSEIFANADNPICLQIRNEQRRFASFTLIVEDRAPGGWRRPSLGRCFLLRLGPGALTTRRYPLHPTRRGPLRFDHFRISTRFPFGLFTKSLRIEAPEEVLVYPAIERLTAPASHNRNGQFGEHSCAERQRSGAGVSGLRTFRPGDTAQRIHWRQSLRRNTLLVREADEERAAEIEIRLRTRAPRAAAGNVDVAIPAFEQRVSWAASEVVCQLEAGRAVSLRTDSQFIPASSERAQRTRLLAYLARVQPRLDVPGSVGGTA